MSTPDGFKFKWPFPKSPSCIYRFASKATLTVVLSFCKLIFSFSTLPYVFFLILFSGNLIFFSSKLFI